MKKRLKKINTDNKAEHILAQDLSPYMHSQNFKPVHFEFTSGQEKVTIQLPEDLLYSLKARARKKGIPCQTLIRQALEKLL